ncbi:MAG: hypothetical protein AAF939_15600 [Planctomycetota bacterium]
MVQKKSKTSLATRFNIVAVLAVTLLIVFPGIVVATPQVYSYQYFPQTVYEKEPVTATRWIDETVMEKKRITVEKPVIQTETRQREIVTYRPIQRTSEREVTSLEQRPVTRTKYRQRRVEETVMAEETRYREERVPVQKRIVETEMREEKVVVKKPITEELIEVKRTTTYKPTFKQASGWTPGTALVPANTGSRYRLQRLDSGYYTDPNTGATVFRRRGLHWVAPRTAAVAVPALVPATGETIDYIPETTVERKPVEVTRMVERVETRKVPVEVEKTVQTYEVRKVPYTVKVPKTKVTYEDVPYTETTYEDYEVTRKVPFTETITQKVVEREPYQVDVQRWVPMTEEVEVPRTVRRKVEMQYERQVPRTVTMRVPLDQCGIPVGPPERVERTLEAEPTQSARRAVSEDQNMGSSTTTYRPRYTQSDGPEPYSAEFRMKPNSNYDGTRSVLNKPVERTETMRPILRNEIESEPRNSALGADIAPAIGQGSSIPKPELPASSNSRRSGDENAADRVL